MKATVCPFAEFFDKEGRWGGGGGGLGKELPFTLLWIGRCRYIGFFFYFHSDTLAMKTVFLFILAVMIVSVTSRSTGKGE